MNDQELAERVVALGVIEWCPRIPDLLRLRNEPSIYWTPHDAVRDPRVAMALMEKCDNYDCWRIQKIHAKWHVGRIIDYDEQCDCNATNESLPRAIVEACVSALEGE